MVDTNNRESRKYKLSDNEDMNINYWIGLMDFLLGGVGSV